MLDYEFVTTGRGTYGISRTVVDRIAYDSARLKSLYANRTVVRTRESSWTDWIAMPLPEVQHVEVDFARARKDGNQFRAAFAGGDTLQALGDWWAGRSRETDFEVLRECLFGLEKEGRQAKRDLRKAQDDASGASRKSLRKAVARGEAAVEVAKFVRDTSADVVLVGAGVLSGGTALALGGAGSLMKGGFKYQDTGNVGAAAVTSVVSFVGLVIPGPVKGGNRALNAGLVFAKTKTDALGTFAVGIMEGQGAGEAAFRTGVELFAGAALNKVGGKLLGADEALDAVKDSLAKVPVPFSYRLSAGQVGLMVGKAGMDSSAGGAKGAAGAALWGAANRKPKPNRQKRQMSDRFLLGDPVLADIAVIGPDRSTAPRRWNR